MQTNYHRKKLIKTMKINLFLVQQKLLSQEAVKSKNQLWSAKQGIIKDKISHSMMLDVSYAKKCFRVSISSWVINTNAKTSSRITWLRWLMKSKISQISRVKTVRSHQNATGGSKSSIWNKKRTHFQFWISIIEVFILIMKVIEGLNTQMNMDRSQVQ